MSRLTDTPMILVLLLSMMTAPQLARAQPSTVAPGTSNTHQKAIEEHAAELVRRAFDEMKNNRVSAACEWFELALQGYEDPRTMFHLAECWGKIGRYASGHYLMLRAAQRVRDNGEAESADYAEKQAEALRQQAPCINVKVPEDLRKLNGFQIELDGKNLPPALWNDTCHPFDVGPHSIVAKAPMRMWNPIHVDANQQSTTQTVEIPPPNMVQNPAPPPPLPPTIGLSPSAKPIGVALIVAGALAGVVGGILLGSENDRVGGAALVTGGGFTAVMGGLGIALSLPEPQKPGPRATTQAKRIDTR